MHAEPNDPGVISHAEPSPPEGDPLLVITDPAVLDRLESAGLSVGRTAFGGGTDVVGTFAGGPRFASLLETLEKDIAEIRASDKKAGVGLWIMVVYVNFEFHHYLY